MAHHGPDPGLPDEDDLDGFETTSSRLFRRFGPWLAVLVAIALVLPVGGWVFDELGFRASGDAVVAQLGEDAELADALLLVRSVGCGGALASGTAFAVDLGDGPVVVTNRHVVEGSRSVGVRPLDGGPAVTVEDHRLSTIADVAVLDLADPGAVTAVLVRGETPSVGDEVRLVGFPAARPFTTDGAVAAVDPARLLLELRTDPGASGSPVVDTDGRVVGQVFARTEDGHGVATPVDRLSHAVSEAVPAPPC